MGKLIVIEGTDCSGKQTQSEKLIERLKKTGRNMHYFSYPNYNSPTGKIIAGPYLAKPAYMAQSYFSEGPDKVSAKVSGLYYAADRLYNMPELNNLLLSGDVVLDRYVDSNMAHQGGKIADKKQRFATYKWFEKLEYGLLSLPKADIKVLLYMPHEYSKVLRAGRSEKLDLFESNEEHLKHAERAYLEIAKRNHYKVINCVKNGQIRSIDDINDELYEYISKKLGARSE